MIHGMYMPTQAALSQEVFTVQWTRDVQQTYWYANSTTAIENYRAHVAFYIAYGSPPI